MNRWRALEPLTRWIVLVLSVTLLGIILRELGINTVIASLAASLALVIPFVLIERRFRADRPTANRDAVAEPPSNVRPVSDVPVPQEYTDPSDGPR